MDDPNMHAYEEDGPSDAEIGRQWREDSSLAKWFPITAARLTALEAENATLAMMLRKCAHRLECNGHEDLSADVLGLLRSFDLLGSPLRGKKPEHG